MTISWPVDPDSHQSEESEELVDDAALLPLEASAADVLDQRRDVPLDEEEAAR